MRQATARCSAARCAASGIKWSQVASGGVCAGAAIHHINDGGRVPPLIRRCRAPRQLSPISLVRKRRVGRCRCSSSRVLSIFDAKGGNVIQPIAAVAPPFAILPSVYSPGGTSGTPLAGSSASNDGRNCFTALILSERRHATTNGRDCE